MPARVPFRVGLISDTHGVLRPAALDFLRGCQHIIHGGDIGGSEILRELSTIAPLTAVRGNNDTGSWADSLREGELISLAGICVFAIHDLSDMKIDLRENRIQAVISGHSHKPLIAQRDGVVFVNPGSAGPRRFKLPIAVGELMIAGGSVSARIVDL
jgi:putative phosphoesterase